jgi:hypothetical protein
MNRVKVAVAGLGVAGLVGLGVMLPAFADDVDTAARPSAAVIEERHAEREAKFAELLAKELGLETAKVQEALKAVREQMKADTKADRLEALKTRLDAAVKDGKLTQEQADAILEAAKKGVFADGLGLGHLRHGPRGFGPGHHWSAG